MIIRLDRVWLPNRIKFHLENCCLRLALSDQNNKRELRVKRKKFRRADCEFAVKTRSDERQSHLPSMQLARQECRARCISDSTLRRSFLLWTRGVQYGVFHLDALPGVDCCSGHKGGAQCKWNEKAPVGSFPIPGAENKSRANSIIGDQLGERSQSQHTHSRSLSPSRADLSPATGPINFLLQLTTLFLLRRRLI